MRWVAWISSGGCIEECDEISRMTRTRMPWSMLKERCERTGEFLLCLALEDPRGGYWPLQPKSPGYWHARAVHVPPGGREVRSCGVGAVIGCEVRVIWGHARPGKGWVTRDSRPVIGCEQIIWAPRFRPLHGGANERVVIMDGRARLASDGRLVRLPEMAGHSPVRCKMRPREVRG